MIKDYFIYLIYVCFVVYGWTASLLGSVWPKISSDIGVDVTLIGILVMINYISSGLSSLFKINLTMSMFLFSLCPPILYLSPFLPL